MNVSRLNESWCEYHYLWINCSIGDNGRSIIGISFYRIDSLNSWKRERKTDFFSDESEIELTSNFDHCWRLDFVDWFLFVEVLGSLWSIVESDRSGYFESKLLKEK